jgi:uncharacterized protein YjbJ (UPF0337 family)
MDENRPEGRAEAIKGGIKEGLGAAVGDVKTEWAGKMERAQGDLQDMYGQAKDTIADATYAAGRQVTTFEDSLRQSIREQPYLAIAVAVGIGICLGRLSARYQSDDEARRVYRY